MLRKSFEIFVKIADWTLKHSIPSYLADFHLQMDASAVNENTFGTNLDVKRRLLLCCSSHVKSPRVWSHIFLPSVRSRKGRFYALFDK